MAEVVDQQQLLTGASAGFGDDTGVKYRGIGFTPALASLTAIEFARIKGSHGIKIFLDTANASSIPDHNEAGAIYAWTVPNASITGVTQKFTLPVEQTLTIGAQYVFYISPWNTGTDAYVNDYTDMTWRAANVYAGGGPIQYTVAGGWTVSDFGNLDAYFKTYGNESASSGGNLHPLYLRSLR